MDKRQARRKKHAKRERRHGVARRKNVQRAFRVMRRDHFVMDGPYSRYTISRSEMLMRLAVHFKCPISEIRRHLSIPDADDVDFSQAELDAEYEARMEERKWKNEARDADALALHCEAILRTVDSAPPSPDVEYAHLSYVEDP